LDLRPGDLMGFIVSPDGGFTDENLLEVSPPSGLQVGRWYHVAGVYDAEQRRLLAYMDGDLIERPLSA